MFIICLFLYLLCIVICKEEDSNYLKKCPDKFPQDALVNAVNEPHEDFALVRCLVDKGIDIDYIGQWGTALINAAFHGHWRIVKYLIKEGAK